MSVQVLVVDDSAVARGIISNFLNSDPDIDVVDTAKDGREAIDLTVQLKPDLITMDINMPVMDGLAATGHIMAHQPTPILVVSSLVKLEVDLAFRAMSLGALDAMEKPSFDQFSAKDAGELVRKSKAAFPSSGGDSLGRETSNSFDRTIHCTRLCLIVSKSRVSSSRYWFFHWRT